MSPILINNNQYNNFNDAPDAFLAATIFHEIIHSYIDGVIRAYAIANPTLNFHTDGANSINPEVVMIHGYYMRYFYNSTVTQRINQAQHNIIAVEYLNTIAKLACTISGLQPKSTNIEKFLPIAWKGLNKNIQGEQVVDKWKNMPDAEKSIMKTKMENINENTPIANPTFNCSNNP